MAKEMVYFNATKQIETLTIHYNSKLDGAFVDDVAVSIKEVAKKMGSKVDLKNPREYYTIQVFVYPSKQLFYKIFSGEIEKRFYSRRRSMEDMYVVKDSDGNIHIVSPRGMGQEKRDAFKRILVIKTLGEYMDEKEKVRAEALLKESMKPKVEEEPEEEIELDEEELEEIEEPNEEIEELEEEEEELTEEELDELIETQNVLDESSEDLDQEEILVEIDDEEELEETEEVEETVNEIKSREQEWMDIGWLAYVRGKLKKEKDIKRFADHISKNGVRKLNQLSSNKVFANYNYSEEYACAIVEYIVSTYGLKKFVEYYNNPKDIEGVFGVTKFRFNNEVKAYIYSKYSDKEMKMDMDEKGVNEITEIHFNKNGGVDIVGDKEIEKEEPEKQKV